MPMTIDKLPDGGVIFHGSGIVMGSETISLNRNLYAESDPAHPIRYQIIDLLNVSDFAMTPSEMQVLARQDIEAFSMNPDMLIAIVMSDDLAYGMNRIYAAYFKGDDEAVCLFKNMQSAKDWIHSKLPNVNL
jgi:hypothetical protein